jgi:PAS domain S-box-containing protein
MPFRLSQAGDRVRLAVVVDDNAGDSLFAANLLKHAGYRVMLCEDGRAALDMIVTKRPNLIISDLIAPNIDGCDLARAVRFDPQTATTPMVLQTAHYLEAEVRQIAAAIGVQEVIVKPYEPQAFLDTIASAVSERAARADGSPAFDFEHMLLVSAKLHGKMMDAEAKCTVLEAAATKYQLLFEAHPEPIWIIDLESRRFLEANEAAIHNYGYSHDDFLAMTINDLGPPSDANRPENVELKGGAPLHRKKDGTVLEVLITTRDLTYAGRKSRYIMAQDLAKRLFGSVNPSTEATP